MAEKEHWPPAFYEGAMKSFKEDLEMAEKAIRGIRASFNQMKMLVDAYKDLYEEVYEEAKNGNETKS